MFVSPPGSLSVTRPRWWRTHWTPCGSHSPSLSERSAMETMTGGLTDDTQAFRYSHTLRVLFFMEKSKRCRVLICGVILTTWITAIEFRQNRFFNVILSASEIDNYYRLTSTTCHLAWLFIDFSTITESLSEHFGVSDWFLWWRLPAYLNPFRVKGTAEYRRSRKSFGSKIK